MRILYVIPRYWPSVGGAQLLSRELVRRMADQHEVRVITQFTSDSDSFSKSLVTAEPGTYLDGQIEVDRIGPTGVWRPGLQLMQKAYGHFRPINPVFALLLNAALLPKLTKFMQAYRPNVVHAVHIGLVYSSETALAAARRMQIPFVWTPFPHIEGGGWSGRRFRQLYRSSDAVIAMTQREKRWLVEQGAVESHVHVIPVGPIVHQQFDAEKFRQTYQLGHAPMVLFLAQKLWYKGYQQLAQAAPIVWNQIPEVRFVFIGPRTPQSIEFFSTRHDERIIELAAIVDPFEKSSALAACDIFCMPSTQESLGGVYLEAWSFSKPVIAANISIAQEVIDNGQDGLLVEQAPQSIAQAIIGLLQDETARRQMGEKGYRKVQERYSWNILMRRMEELYTNLGPETSARGDNG